MFRHIPYDRKVAKTRIIPQMKRDRRGRDDREVDAFELS